MDIKSYCPGCGVHTIVELTQEEKVSYFRYSKKLPKDFNSRAICPCCIDDGYKSSGDHFSLYNQSIHL